VKISSLEDLYGTNWGKVNKTVYKRILLKLSGEALMGNQPYGIDYPVLQAISGEIKAIVGFGVQLGVVMGGGNIFRGIQAESKYIERNTADYIGMLATVMNSLTLQSALGRIGVESVVQSAIDMIKVAESFTQNKAIDHLLKGKVVIFAGGTGNPYFTTDTAAALRGAEIKAEAILKATKVDGVYDKDPVKHVDAKIFKEINYNDVLAKNLKVMDATAVSLCRENKIPIIVFNLLIKGNIERVITGKSIGTVIKG
jgi:uridylate kinase